MSGRLQPAACADPYRSVRLRERLPNLEPELAIPAVLPRPHAETVQDSALRSLTGVSREGMVDEREAELIQRVLRGEANAYDEILTPHLPMAVRLAYSLVRNRDRADDCVQEAAIKGWKRLENLKPETPFRPWFLGIVIRRCREDIRSRWHSVVLLVDPEQWPGSGDDDWLKRSQQGAALRRAFAGLPLDQREAAHLFLVEGLSQAEVADAMKVSVSNVKAKIDRAKKRLRAALEEER
jgi:RNA polymerase sigma factor (sigma-70 family)